MERLTERLSIARRAHGTLADILTKPKSAEIRDATIQRFEYTFEAVWKAAALQLRVVHGIESASPKGTVRHCRQFGLLTEAESEQALLMIADRNLSVHTYNEALAEAIYARIPNHARVLDAWLAALTATAD